MRILSCYCCDSSGQGGCCSGGGLVEVEVAVMTVVVVMWEVVGSRNRGIVMYW